MVEFSLNVDSHIAEIFIKSREIILSNKHLINNEDFRRQANIIETMRYPLIDDEPNILNQLVVQALSYSKLRKFLGVYYTDCIHKLDYHFGTSFFEPNKVPSFNCDEWKQITLTWGNLLLSKERLDTAKNLIDLEDILRNAVSDGYKNLRSQVFVPRVVWSLATAITKVEREILPNPKDFLKSKQDISEKMPGKAYDQLKNFANGIEQMGVPLVSNFFKEIGLLYYVKLDVHVNKILTILADNYKISDTNFDIKNERDKFIFSWILAHKAGIPPFYPFFIDKIMYVGRRFLPYVIDDLFITYAREFKIKIYEIIKSIRNYR